MSRVIAGLALSFSVLVTLSGCAARPQLVMVNPRTGDSVDCQVPDATGNSGTFLVSRACLSACQAHGFRPMPNVQANSSNTDTPKVCNN